MEQFSYENVHCSINYIVSYKRIESTNYGPATKQRNNMQLLNMFSRNI